MGSTQDYGRGNAVVTDGNWRKRKQLLQKRLKKYNETAWKPGGYTVNNCESLKRKVVKELLVSRSDFPNKYRMLPGIGHQSKDQSEDPPQIVGVYQASDLVDEHISQSKSEGMDRVRSQYEDTVIMNDCHVTYVKKYLENGTQIVFRNREFNRKAKVGSLDNAAHKPQGGNVKIPNQPVQWSYVQPKINSLVNVGHKAAGGHVKIPTFPVEWHAVAKIDSMSNIEHQPGGGNSSIFHQKLEWISKAKVGSLENIDHIPGRSCRTWRDYITPFRKRLLGRKNVIWTEGFHQAALKNPQNLHAIRAITKNPHNNH